MELSLLALNLSAKGVSKDERLSGEAERKVPTSVLSYLSSKTDIRFMVLYERLELRTLTPFNFLSFRTVVTLEI